MPMLRAFLILGLFALLHGCAPIKPAPEQDVLPAIPGMPSMMKQALDRAGIPETAAGIYIQDVSSGKLAAVSNPGTPLNPASAMKLLTTYAALDLLGPAFTWKTQALTTGAIVDDVLYGDLVIKGGGDPKLVWESLWLFLRQIRAKGVREIRGNLQLDASIFQNAGHDPGAFDGEPIRPYNVGPDGLLVNYKTLSFRFMPDTVAGITRVGINPAIADYKIMRPALAPGECGDWKAKLQPSFSAEGAIFRGTYAASCGERVWHVHPLQLNHGEYFSAVFRHLWSELGGSLHGAVTSGPAPADAQLLVEWQSPPLAEIIRDINKYSNNVMARQLLLTLGLMSGQTPATPMSGAQVVKAWLASKGIDATELVIENGSGLSRHERISAGALGRMLVTAYRSPVMPEFIASMPLVGHDGSMRQRLKNGTVAGHAHVKTGSLQDVRAIAGYVLAASGRRYAIVSIINHPHAAAAREAHDVLLQWIYDHG